jgi:protoporphyrinogen oxidase
MRAAVFPIRPERSLEDFFINRFGRELYQTFFKSYTEKVWGTPCSEISAEWGKQRIKGLSVWKSIVHVVGRRNSNDVAQKGTETSLIEKFMYPKYGPGQMWEEVADQVITRGGQILTGYQVDRIEHDRDAVVAVCATRVDTGEKCRFEGQYVLSTMPVKELIACLVPAAPAEVRQISDGLVYRDFITVGILCKELQIRDAAQQTVRDNWIYIQEPDVLVGRMQVFNNWSPYLVADPSTTWIGLEYFCNESDALWKKPDAEIAALAVQELESMNIVARQDVLDSTVIRVPKAYPAYFGTYDRFEEIKRYVDRFENLFLMGRNGMHKYNNQDHSMLAAMVVVDNIAQGITSKENIWSVNTEQEYQES